MHSVVIKLPDSVNFDETELTWQLAASLYNQEKLSLGQAAEMVGVSKRTFMEMMGKYGGMLFSYPEGDVKRDLERA